jgi:hypothetical protein
VGLGLQLRSKNKLTSTSKWSVIRLAISSKPATKAMGHRAEATFKEYVAGMVAEAKVSWPWVFVLSSFIIARGWCC